MPFDTPEKDLEFTIRLALQLCKYKPPRTHDAGERDRYFNRVAEAVRKKLEESGYEIKKLPPNPGMDLTRMM